MLVIIIISKADLISFFDSSTGVWVIGPEVSLIQDRTLLDFYVDKKDSSIQIRHLRYYDELRKLITK